MTPENCHKELAALKRLLKEETSLRRKAEDALEAQGQFFSGMLDAMDGMAIECVDRHHRLLWANTTIARMAGKPLEEMQGHQCYNAIRNQDASCPECGVQQVLATGKPHQFMRRGPDNTVWEVRSYPLFDAQGHVEKVLNVGVEVTETLARAEALGHTETAYRALFENAPIGIYSVDLDGQYQSMNPTHAAMYGYESPEVMLSSITSANEVFADAEQRRFLLSLLEKKEVVRGFESLMRRKDGSLFWTSRTIRANTSPAGEVTGYTGYVQDIQARKDAETASEQSRNQLLDMLERLQNCVTVLDPATERILYANEHARLTMGPHLIGKSWQSCLDETQPYVSLQELTGTGDGEHSMEVRLKDGSWRLVSFKHISWQGRDGLLMVGTNITPLKEAEALKEDVSLIMQHDLRSPLAGVVSLPALLMDSPGLAPDEKAILRSISTAGRRVMEIIDSSLLLFQMERGEYHLSSKPVGIADVLLQIQANSQDIFALKKATLELQYVPTPQALLAKGDAAMLYSCLSNLIKNALEASPEHETVTVTASANGAPSSPVTISIHNQGQVPPEILDRFFEKYATHGKKGGTGLGTYSANLIAKAHGGSISVASTEAEGTTVTVELPGM